MATFIWGWAFAWLAWRLVLEWRIGSQWRPDCEIWEEDRPTGGRTPPPDALTSEGERLWRQRWLVNLAGVFGWCALVAIAVVRTLAH
jgi:hypothetical protein